MKSSTHKSKSAFISDTAGSDTATEHHGTMARTRCSHCLTVFEIAPEFLTSSDTRARCGECMSIFDVLSNLQHDNTEDDVEHDASQSEGVVDEVASGNAGKHSVATDFLGTGDFTRAAEVVKSEELLESNPDGIRVGGEVGGEDKQEGETGLDEAQSLDLTHSDHDMFSGDVDLPEVPYFDQTQDAELLRFNEPDGDETFSDTLFANDMTVESPMLADGGADAPADNHVEDDTGLSIPQDALAANVDFITDDGTIEPPAFAYSDREEASQSARTVVKPAVVPDTLQEATATRAAGRSWRMPIILATLIILFVGVLYAYKERRALMQNPTLRPHLVKLCSHVGCDVPVFVNLDKLKVLKRSVFSHPSIENALVIDLAFVNEAAVAQPHPVLEIRLTDRNGRLVVQNSVVPKDYLDEFQEGSVLEADERLDLSLTVEDPGQTATSFELNFR